MSLPNHILNLQALKNISHCPLCRKKYQPLQATLLEENEEAHLIYIKCSHCQSSMVVLIMSQGPVVSSMGVVTDLNPKDLAKIKQRGFLKEDDILAVHNLFKDKILIKELIKEWRI